LTIATGLCDARTIVRELLAVAAVVVVLGAAPSAAQAVCAVSDELSVRLAQSDAAVVGTVSERREEGAGAVVYVLSVERVVAGTVPTPVIIREGPPLSSVALNLASGERVGLLLLRRDDEWTSNSCLQLDPDALARAADIPPCAPGSSRPAEPVPGEGVRPITRRYVLGCGSLPSGRRFALEAYRLTNRGGGSSVCIDAVDRASGLARGCGSDRVRGDGHVSIDGALFAGARVELRGTTSRRVARVVLQFRRAGRRATRRAVLVRVRDNHVLRVLGSAPFGHFVAEIPPGARGVAAVASDARGRVLDRAPAPRF